MIYLANPENDIIADRVKEYLETCLSHAGIVWIV